LRLNGKISRDGTLYLDLSAHFAQYNNAVVERIGVSAGALGKYIHLANLLSLLHVRFGISAATSAVNAGFSGDTGSKRKSITSHLSILI
jgi:hypothetical protein